MTVRDFVIFISDSPDIEIELESFKPQEVLISIDGKDYPVKELWIRGDNKLIIEALKGEE